MAEGKDCSELPGSVEISLFLEDLTQNLSRSTRDLRYAELKAFRNFLIDKGNLERWIRSALESIRCPQSPWDGTVLGGGAGFRLIHPTFVQSVHIHKWVLFKIC